MVTKDEATKQINAILRDLERATGQHVEGITLRRLDVTRLESVNVQHAVTVEIDLVRLPGSEWAA